MTDDYVAIPPEEHTVVCPFCNTEHTAMLSETYNSPAFQCQCGKNLMAVYDGPTLEVHEVI
jgi:hypothetical protein